MKFQKCIILVLFFALIIAMIPGCGSGDDYYAFRQDLEHVEKVSVFSYDPETDTRTLIVDLEEPDAKELTSILATMKCGKYFPGDHIREYGHLLIALTYTNGEIELIGFYNTGWITPDGVEYLSNYYFDEKEVYDLICRFVDPEMLPDIIEEYPNCFS